MPQISSCHTYSQKESYFTSYFDQCLHVHDLAVLLFFCQLSPKKSINVYKTFINIFLLSAYSNDFVYALV